MGDNDSLHNQNSDERQAKKKTTDEPVNTNAESDDDADSNASSEYEVEKILGKRRRRRGGYEYYIKWVGYDDSANEWIPESSLNCPERLAEFEREAKLQQKRRQQKYEGRRSRNSRRTSTRGRKRRVNVVHDDDDDDDAEGDTDLDPGRENNDTTTQNDGDEEETTKSVDTSISSTSKSTVEKKANATVTYGVEKGYKVQAVLGINRSRGDELYYLVHYQSPTTIEDNMELIPAHVAKKFCEDEIIQFYESRITWNDPHDV